MLQTLRKEICRYDIVSFDIFDTLLLRDVLFPNDIFHILGTYVEQNKGIAGFQYIRQNEEQNIRQESIHEDITLDEIYDRIERVLGVSCQDIMQQEMNLEAEYLIQNPIIKQVFDMAIKENKQIWILSDMYLPYEFLAKILSDKGYNGYQRLVVSGEFRKAKFSGNMYRELMDITGVNPQKWLHIGDNIQSDIEIPRKMGITAYHYVALRDRYFSNKKEERFECERQGEATTPSEKVDSGIESSIKLAKVINDYYTQVSEPNRQNVVEIEDVSMMFNLNSEKIDNLKEYFIKFIKGCLRYNEFWALKDVSLSIRRGERIGLVGLNGSGKSTILKIVSGVLKATKGKVSIYGVIAPLIELGAGFDINLSAHENIFLNGAILGYSRTQMQEKYDEIIDFAELRDFEDVPIKNFSSGMVARLGFAIATCHTPDILIIDEILSVGDFAFQQKCHRKMKQLTDNGVTVLFVSHSAVDIINMCDRAIWLDHGTIVAEGEAQYIVEKYLNNNF